MNSAPPKWHSSRPVCALLHQGLVKLPAGPRVYGGPALFAIVLEQRKKRKNIRSRMRLTSANRQRVYRYRKMVSGVRVLTTVSFRRCQNYLSLSPSLSPSLLQDCVSLIEIDLLRSLFTTHLIRLPQTEKKNFLFSPLMHLSPKRSSTFLSILSLSLSLPLFLHVPK
jgi:hypothetical protein